MSATDSLTQVEVLGIAENIPDDYLPLYFENKRRSGGGPVESCIRKGSVALITFSDPCDAERVLSRPEHCVLNVKVQVRRPPPWDLKKVALCGLDPSTEQSVLEMYIENVSGQETFSIFYSADRTTVLVTFPEGLTEDELRSLITNVEQKKLKSRPITAERVHVCGDVLVENFSRTLTSELLEMYFENKRSGGGEVSSVTMLKNGSAAVVSFTDCNVTERVLSRSHSLQCCQLSVSPFYPGILGFPNNDAPDDKEMKVEESEEATGSPEQSCEKVLEVPEVGKLMFHANDDNSCGMEVGDVVEKTGGHIGGLMEVQMDELYTDVQQTTPQILSDNLASAVNGLSELNDRRALHSPDTTQDMYKEGSPDEALPSGSSAPRVDVKSTSAGEPSFNVQEREVLMEAAELLFLQRYHHELLAGMTDVTILPLDEKDVSGFKVSGDAFSCRTAVELLQHIVSTLASRTVTLEYPWVAPFLLESEGQRTLRDVEEYNQCIIDTSRISWKVLDCVYVDPWSFVNDGASTESSPDQPMVTEEASETEDPLLKARLEDIKAFASLLKNADSEKQDNDIPEKPPSLITIDSDDSDEDSDEDIYTEKAGKDTKEAKTDPKDEELDKVCQMSRMEYQDRELDEEAQMLLAIQRSMEVTKTESSEDEDLQKALELSLRQQEAEEMEESLQRALEMSFREQWGYGSSKAVLSPEMPSTSSEVLPELSSHCARVRVLAGDETNLVVACAALRKAVTSRQDVDSLEGIGDVQNLSEILEALEKKHKVKITTKEGQLEIKGFLDSPSKCRQDLCKIVEALQRKDQVQTDMMNLDVQRDVELIDVSEDSEEYNRIIPPFITTLEKRKLSTTVFKLQKVHNPLLYNQYQLKKQRMQMIDPNKPVERLLYHGTSEDSTKEICHGGFNRSFCGKNAALYGQGVYFAQEAELSMRDNYSPPNKEGKKFVFLARVLTGEYTVGKESMRTPPLMPDTEGKAPKRYDCLVNCQKDPMIFVIFNDTQAYPQYLITCSKCKDMGARVPPV
ncbi:protein mono-ADP-ribosyltransferase PARP10 [Hyperolius riggenbachi]|uniref:protein mono-ADP-ribosyltransferase PARP10 n=1 Tax=Hyperolius riggenbachi TaxID=752182 RepID=UPI0035A27C50